MDRPIAAFDIETIPDPVAGRRVFGLTGTDEEVVAAMVERRRADTDGRTEYPELPFHRIVTIGVAWLDPAHGRFKLGTCGAESDDERTILESFFQMFRRARTSPRIVSWNGSGFDLPVIRYRAMQNGLAAPELHRTDGEWRWNNYQNRYHDMHVDLMDTVGGYGASKWVSLEVLSQAMGLPGKRFVDGEVYTHWLAGEHARVRDYCKLDVVHTLLLYLVWEVHRGRLDHETLRAHAGAVVNALRDETADGWVEVCERLEAWPPWPPVSQVLFEQRAEPAAEEAQRTSISS
jgi:hypothetical protein